MRRKIDTSYSFLFQHGYIDPGDPTTLPGSSSGGGAGGRSANGNDHLVESLFRTYLEDRRRVRSVGNGGLRRVRSVKRRRVGPRGRRPYAVRF